MLNYKNGVSVQIRTFLTSVLQTCEWISSYLCYFTNETEESFGEEDGGGGQWYSGRDKDNYCLYRAVNGNEVD
jgi:hypothetical protein